MKNASTATKKALLAVTCLTAALIFPQGVKAAAGGVQVCTVGTTCTVGEFLFDDNSAPIAGATCTISSSKPDHTSFLSSVALSGGGSDGWYYYEFTAPSTTGMYSTTISCTVSGDTLSIDKSFEVAAASTTDTNSIASAVWNYSGKTLDSFGSLPSDIWSYSSRTVSSFGSLVSDVWDSATRTLTGAGLSSGSLATQDDVTSVRNNIDNLSTTNGDLSKIKSTVEQNRLLLEQVVNKPIIQNVLEDTTPPISQKLDGTRAQANQLYVNNQFLTTQSAKLTANWNTLSGKDALESVIAIAQVVGESGDTSSGNSMFASANWIKDSWSWDESVKISQNLSAIQNLVSDLKTGLAEYQKTPSLKADAKQLVTASLALEKVIGTTNDTAESSTLFGKITSTSNLALNLDNETTQISSTLADYKKTNDSSSILQKLADLQNQVIALNKVPGAIAAITQVSASNPNSITNNLLSLNGVVNSNKKLLALGSGQTMVNVWLEVGSIIFKTVATNPSKLIAQDVDVKYYLPQEIKQEDIIKTDAGLTVSYDNDKNQLYVEGTFKLDPGQTRTFSVETKDIWSYPQSTIDSLRNQADQLSAPLQKTAYYAQGVTLKSDIDANLDQMMTLQASAQTPDDKIRVYRECVVLKKSVDDKLTAMKDLVTQASAAGNLFGFVGGSQTIAVWGIIVIVAAGFIFLTIYMKTVIGKAGKSVDVEETKPNKKATLKVNAKKSSGNMLKFTVAVVISCVLSSATTGLVVYKLGVLQPKNVSVLGTQDQAKPQQEPTSQDQNEPATGGVDTVKIVVPYGIKLDVFSDKAGLQKVSDIAETQNATRIDSEGNFTQILLKDNSKVWVKSAYIKDGKDLPDDTTLMSGSLVTVKTTPTGWLNVRDSASATGTVFTKVNPGEKYDLVGKDLGWDNIVLQDGSFGWISSTYATISE